MTEPEKVIMLYTLLVFVKQIHDGDSHPTPLAILQQLQRSEDVLREQLRSQP